MLCKTILHGATTAFIARILGASARRDAKIAAVVAPATSAFTAASALPTSTPIEHVPVIYRENVSLDRNFATHPNATNPFGEPAFAATADTPKAKNLGSADLLTNNPTATNTADGSNAAKRRACGGCKAGLYRSTQARPRRATWTPLAPRARCCAMSTVKQRLQGRTALGISPCAATPTPTLTCPRSQVRCPALKKGNASAELRCPMRPCSSPLRWAVSLAAGARCTSSAACFTLRGAISFYSVRDAQRK